MFCVVDIGGSNMRMALANHGVIGHAGVPRLLATQIDPTPRFYNQFIERLKSYVASHDKALLNGALDRIVIGIPGTRLEGMITSCPFLPDFVGRHIVHDIAEALGIPAAHVHVYNDAYVVGVGEYAAAHQMIKNLPVYASVAYITISTGVGGAVYSKQEMTQWIEHQTVPAATLLPPGYEPGRQIIDSNPDMSLEDLISGAATERRFGRKPREVTDASYWNWSAHYLACGIWNAMCLRSIHQVILGGPMITRKPGIDIAHVREHLGKLVHSRPGIAMPGTALAVHDDIGGLVGAVYIARAHHSQKDGMQSHAHNHTHGAHSSHLAR